jgi:hypothetical protein
MKHLIAIFLYDVVIFKVVRWELYSVMGNVSSCFYIFTFTYENSKILPILGTKLFLCVKTNKCTNYSFNLLSMYSSSYMFRYYIAILRERS